MKRGRSVRAIIEVGFGRGKKRITKSEVNDRGRLNPGIKRGFESGVESRIEEKSILALGVGRIVSSNNDPSRFPAPIDISVHGHFLVHGAGDARDFNFSTEIFKICRDTGAKPVYSVPGCDNQRRQLKWEKILLGKSDGGGEKW